MLAFSLIDLMLTCLFPTPIMGAVLEESPGVPNVPASTAADSGTWPATYAEDADAASDTAYVESTVTYKGKASYYFLTQDLSYTDGSIVFVAFDGTSGSVTVGPADGDTIFECTVFNLTQRRILQRNCAGKQHFFC